MNHMQQARERAGYSKARLSLLAGVNYTTVCEFESGRRKPYPKAAAKLSAALGWEGDPMALFEKVGEADE